MGGGSLGSLEARQSSGYLRDHFEKLGYSVSFSHFEATIKGREEVGRNVLAYREGAHPEIVAVVAHYDTAPTTVQGAIDNGAAIGVLLELARVFSDSFRHGLLLIASDGEEAIEKLEVYNYALVIADSQMPKVSGITLLKYLKRHFSDTPVAIISTRDSAQTGRLAAKYKADYYLSKPIRMFELEGLVENALLKHAG